MYEIENENSFIDAAGLSDRPSAIVPHKKPRPSTAAEMPYTQPMSPTGIITKLEIVSAIVYRTMDRMTFSWLSTTGSMGTPAAV